MPLPAGTMTWPPAELDAITPKLSEWAAWYSGDPDTLSSAYTKGEKVRPSQQAGGVVGAVARWFWGQPTSSGQQRSKLHVPIAADLATASSDLLFAEPPRIVTPEGYDRSRLDEILAENSWETLLPEAGEIAAAFGGVYKRVTWDATVSQHAIITPVHADAAWPEFRFGRLHAVTFWQIVGGSGQQVYRHLEKHEKGRIEHGLYVGTKHELGQRVPLAEHPATAGLAGFVDETSAVATGSTLLTAEYIPNIRPSRLSPWRNHALGAHLGRSDFQSIEPLFDAIDETYSSWMRDIRLAKGRIFAAQELLRTQGRGQGASFDLDQEVFVGLNAPTAEEGLGLTSQQFEIRAEEHLMTIQELLERVIGTAGYSLQTFGLGDGGPEQTATEVSAKQKRSMTTREKKTRYWSPKLAHILRAALDVEAHVFGGPASPDVLTVEFAASVQPTELELAQTAAALKGAQAASTKTLVQMVHPDWDPDAVDAEVALIMQERAITVPDVGPLPDDPDLDFDDDAPVPALP